MFLAGAIAFGVSMFVNGIAKGEDSGQSLKLTEKEQSTWNLDLPLVIFDDSAGDWVVDRFAGNSSAGSRFYQGPALEVGGLQLPGGCVDTEDGTVYMTCGLQGSSDMKLLKVAADGVLRLVMEEIGSVEGPMEACRAGGPIWNPKERGLYLTGPNCLRRIVEKPDGSRWVEVVAGIPGKAGYNNGPAKKATFQSQCRGVVCNASGIFFWLEDKGLRRIENGIVSSVPLKFVEAPSKFGFAMAGGLLSLGENDDTLYIIDFYGNPDHHSKRILKCDLKSGELTRICGVNTMKEQMYRHRDKWRYGKESDGPALTHVGGNSGIRGRYDPFYNALWIWGPDHVRFRWLRLDGDGWVRTVFGAMKPGTKAQPFGINELNTIGVPGEQFRFYLCHVVGIDSKGGIFISEWADQSGFWRAYNKKKGSP